MIVKIKGPGIKLQGKWCFVGEESYCTQNEYIKNKEYLEVIEHDNDKIPENLITQDKNDNNDDKEKDDNNQDEKDKELQELREKAKEYGIRNCHLMKKEKLIEEIEKIENPITAKENDNQEGE